MVDKRLLPIYMDMISLLTVLAGAILFWNTSGGLQISWVKTGPGIVLRSLWEEGGWRGFALPRLQERYGPFTGSIILGAMWAFWHLPGYLGGWMATEFPALLIYCVGFSILATWIYNNTSGRIIRRILLHSSSNAAISVGSMDLPANLSVQMNAFVLSGWIPAVMIGITAGLVLIFTKDNLAYQRT